MTDYFRKNIRRVAIYLRKSRGDKEKNILQKHRERLTSYANSQGWAYDIFEETVSGERLSTRPQMLKLLDLVEQGCYDGVLVAEYQRLSRGGSKDFGEIVEVLQYSDTLIITPQKVYDSNDLSDLTILGIEGVFSNTELKTIVRRLQEGKKDGARQGKWVNGKPPYPYEYVKRIMLDEKGKDEVVAETVVNPEKEKIYNLMKSMYLKGDSSTQQIAVFLNKSGVPSPLGSTWHNNQVKRILTHEFHLGRVIYGRYEWKKSRDNRRRATRLRDESEWQTGMGAHTQLKTPEEHQRILEILARNNRFPRRSRQGCQPTSGIMFCKKCNHRMSYSMGKPSAKTGVVYYSTKCSHKDPFGNKCRQVGVIMDEAFYNALLNAIVTNYLDESKMLKMEGDSPQSELRKKENQLKQAELAKAEREMQKIQDAYMFDAYTPMEFARLKKDKQEKIKKLQMELQGLETQNSSTKAVSKSDLKRRVSDFKRNWPRATSNKEKHNLLKTIVDRIIYNREGNVVTFEIEYL